MAEETSPQKLWFPEEWYSCFSRPAWNPPLGAGCVDLGLLGICYTEFGKSEAREPTQDFLLGIQTPPPVERTQCVRVRVYVYVCACARVCGRPVPG